MYNELRPKLWLLWFLCLPVLAGYRVYELEIEHLDDDGNAARSQKVKSNLDPNQYEAYHAGYGRMRVRLIDHWFCPGDTSFFREYCEKPVGKGPSSLKDPKRLPLNRQPVRP